MKGRKEASKGKEEGSFQGKGGRKLPRERRKEASKGGRKLSRERRELKRGLKRELKREPKRELKREHSFGGGEVRANFCRGLFTFWF